MITQNSAPIPSSTRNRDSTQVGVAVVGYGSPRDLCPDEFISAYLKMTSCLRPYMDTIRPYL